MRNQCEICLDDITRCGGNPFAKKCSKYVAPIEDYPKADYIEDKYLDYNPHYYIKGHLECNTRRIIDRLIVMKGNNVNNYQGCDPHYAYYIGPEDQVIHKIAINSPEFRNLMVATGWIELK